MTGHIVVWSDGASKGNPGPGGWGAIVAYGAQVVERGGREDHTTNNRMELTAVIRAFEELRTIPGCVVVHTDSSYVISGITSWLENWRRRNWKTIQKKDVVNRDLWETLSALIEERSARIEWKHVGGHVGIPGNERVDEIASSYAEGKAVELFSGARAQYTVDLSETVADTGRVEKRQREKSGRGARSRAQAYSYVSAVGGVIETHATWAECERRVKGVAGARFKKALSASEEQEIIASFS